MALYAFDGTGKEDRDDDDRDTNVLDFFRGYQDPPRNDDLNWISLHWLFQNAVRDGLPMKSDCSVAPFLL